MENVIETKTQFIQYNKPGIVGYSQLGSIGDTGAAGSQIYFTPYSGDASTGVITNILNSGKELSNNKNYDSVNVDYSANDLILDINGDLWKIGQYNEQSSTDEIIVKYSIYKQNNILSYYDSSFIANLDVSNVTSASLNTIHSYAQPKPSDVTTESLPYQFYRDRYYSCSYGNWYRMDVSFYKETTLPDNYVYKFVVVLPSGITVEKVSTYKTDYIFIDNRILYGERTITDSSIYNRLKNTIHYTTGINNNEKSKSTVDIFDILIKAVCKIYAEIIDKNSGKVYRIYYSKTTS
jgi:hypothetical protein